ncbi:MAG: hypothetical protein AAGA75_12450 [Cyanobacteria bacterium P01_E01_bin.6]
MSVTVQFTSSDWRSPLFVVRLIRTLSWRTLLITLVGVSGCQSLNQPLPLKLTGRIRSVNAIQTRVNVGSTLYVKGTVGERVPLIQGQVYELEDSTGRIWVVTKDATIATGEELLIRGTLSYLATPDFGVDVGERYLWETDQVERSP